MHDEERQKITAHVVKIAKVWTINRDFDKNGRLIGDFSDNNDISQSRYKKQQNKIGKGRQNSSNWSILSR
jgi:hypothetical protein